MRRRDRPTLDPVSSNIRLRFLHERDEQIGRDGQIDLWPDFFIVGGNLDVGDGGARWVVGMGVVDYLQVEIFISNILLCNGKVLHIHHEGDLGALCRRQSFQMRNLGRVKGRQFLGSFERHDIFDPIDMGDGSIGSGQESTTLVGIEFPGVGHHVVED